MKRLFLLTLALLAVLCVTGCAQEPAATPTPPSSEAAQLPAPEQFSSADLGKYVIIYSGSNPDYFDLAYRLSDHIYTQYGVCVVPACDVNAEPTAYEILIGDTNRYDDSDRVMEYSVTVDGSKFRIHAGGSFSCEAAVDRLCAELFNGTEFTLENGEYFQTSLLTTTQELTEGSTLRLMTANLLADAFADGSYKKAYYRAELFAGMLVSYTPDVLGLQETDVSWNSVLDFYLDKLQKAHGLSYSRHWATHQDKVNYTSLLYRSDKFKVEKGDVNTFRWWTNEAFSHPYHMRNISWAQFTSLENKDHTFIVANTHWSYRTEHSEGSTYLAGASQPIAVNELRLQCKDETNAYLSLLRQENPETPIFLTGDFNTSLSFFTESDWTPNGFRLISEDALGSGKSVSLVPSSGFYDHLFGSGSYTIDYYAILDSANYHSLLTDHPFAYTDLTL